MSGQDDYTNGNDTWSTAIETTSGTTWGGWAPTVPVQGLPPGAVVTGIEVNGVDIGDMFQKKEENMRSLFRITVVNPKTEVIEEALVVIAKDREGALLKAGFRAAIRTNSDQYDFLVEHVGDVRAKKEVGRVKIVKEDEE